MCILCGDETNAADHSFQKVTLTQQIHDKAVAVGEDRVVALLAEGDVVAIEAKYHRNSYTGFNRRYNATCKQDTASENLEATAENELLQFIKEEVTGGRRIFALQDLTDMMTERLEQHGIQKTVNRTRLKERVLEHFPSLKEEKGIRDRVFIICSKTARKVISSAIQTPDEESRTLLMAASILRKAVVDHDTAFKFDASFPRGLRRIICSTTYKVFLPLTPRRTQIIARAREFQEDSLFESVGHAKYDFSLRTCLLSLHFQYSWPSNCIPKQEAGRTTTKVCSERVI